MESFSHQDVVARDNIRIFEYALNSAGIKTLEFGAFFLFAVAALVYPLTHFDPWGWMIVPAVLGIAGIGLVIAAQYWRIFAKNAFIAFDDDYFFVSNDKNRAAAIPWTEIGIESAGLKDPKAGANFKMHIGNQTVRVRLFTPFVCIPRFDSVLAVILTHIKENEDNRKAAEKRSKHQ